MNKLKYFVGLAFMALSLVMAQNAFSAEKAMLTFDCPVYDFGTINEKDGMVSCEFPFVNAGNGNLVIMEAKAECGCTRPEFPQKPIAPGKKGVIKVKFNPAGRAGSFSKNITVKCNGKPSKVVLKIKGVVVPKQ